MTDIVKRIDSEISAEVAREMTARNSQISCGGGCDYCCSQHVRCGLAEGEVIVNFLYENPSVLAGFVEKYRAWRDSLDMSLIQELNRAGQSVRPDSRDTIDAYLDLAAKYSQQNLPCPFLEKGHCIIYPVRPSACMGMFSTSKPEACQSTSTVCPDIILVSSKLRDSLSEYYYGNGRTVVLSPMPILVYELLNYGVAYIAKIPGMRKIEADFFDDPVVQNVIRDVVY